MCKTVLFLFFVLVSNFSYCQDSRNELTFLIKLTLFHEAVGGEKYVADATALNNFLRLDFKIDTLRADGFLDFVFFSIDPKLKNPLNVDLETTPLLIGNCDEFVIALKGKTIYRLKGFMTNDFRSFFEQLDALNYDDISTYRRFTENYFVEKLDIGCLYLASKKNATDKNKYKCLASCSEVKNIQ